MSNSLNNHANSAFIAENDPAGVLGSFPIDSHFNTRLADALARLETYNKHHYRPNTYLHKWWARRCGSTFRLILKHLVADPEKQDYYTAGGLEGKVVLDPMMGGGTTLHEAIRMGAHVIGVDIDPIPVMQARATLHHVPLPELEAAFLRLHQALNQSLGKFFTTSCPKCEERVPFRYILYGLQRHCACGPVILMDSLILRYEDGEPAVWLCARCGGMEQEGDSCACAAGEGAQVLPERGLQKRRLLNRREQQCAKCGEPFREDDSLRYYQRYRPVVVVGQCPQDGVFYKLPDGQDLHLLHEADRERDQLPFNNDKEFRVVNIGPKSKDLTTRHIKNYTALFSSRQLLYLTEAVDQLSQFSEAVRLNLALLVSTSLEFNSLLCGYKGARRGERPGAIRHTFSYHAFTFPYTALENNVLLPEKSSGTLQKIFYDRILRARKWADQPQERQLNSKKKFVPVPGEKDWGTEVTDLSALTKGKRRFYLHQGSATALPVGDEKVDFIVTDPPYFDSVQYSELAAFFRVWLRKLMPGGGNWDYDPADSAVDPHSNRVAHVNGEGQYTQVLSGIFTECRRVLRPGVGRLVFTFHHWKPRGWAALTIALQRAGFVLVNRYVVQSENPVSVHIANVSSLKHDAILVLATGDDEQPKEWDRPEAIDKTDSYAFTRDCARMLGWLLVLRHPEGKIHQYWHQLLD